MTNGEMLNELQDMAKERRRAGTSREEFRMALASIQEINHKVNNLGETMAQVSVSLAAIQEGIKTVSEKSAKYDIIVEKAMSNPMYRFGGWMRDKPKSFYSMATAIGIAWIILSTVWLNPNVRLVVFDWIGLPQTLVKLLIP